MCVYKSEDGLCRLYTDDKYTSYCVMGPCDDEVPSIADRIRSMNDEELAKFICDLMHEEAKKLQRFLVKNKMAPVGYSCMPTISYAKQLEHIRQPYKGDDMAKGAR